MKATGMMLSLSFFAFAGAVSCRRVVEVAPDAGPEIQSSIASSDSGFERASRPMDRPRSQPSSHIIVIETLGDQTKYYKKPRARIPDIFRLYRTSRGSIVEVARLHIACVETEPAGCVLIQFESPMYELQRHEITRRDLAWLPATDILGLPESEGGRKPMSAEEEGKEVPPQGCNEIDSPEDR